MMKDDIKKAAAEYAYEACRLLWRTGKEQVCMADFIEGANWRINSVWHSNTEMPNRNLDKYYCGEELLIQTVDGKFNFGKVYYGYGYNGKMFYTVTCRDKTYSMDEIKRWTYVKDLTPNMED